MSPALCPAIEESLAGRDRDIAEPGTIERAAIYEPAQHSASVRAGVSSGTCVSMSCRPSCLRLPYGSTARRRVRSQSLMRHLTPSMDRFSKTYSTGLPIARLLPLLLFPVGRVFTTPSVARAARAWSWTPCGHQDCSPAWLLVPRLEIRVTPPELQVGANWVRTVHLCAYLAPRVWPAARAHVVPQAIGVRDATACAQPWMGIPCVLLPATVTRTAKTVLPAAATCFVPTAAVQRKLAFPTK